MAKGRKQMGVQHYIASLHVFSHTPKFLAPEDLHRNHPKFVQEQSVFFSKTLPPLCLVLKELVRGCLCVCVCVCVCGYVCEKIQLFCQ